MSRSGVDELLTGEREKSRRAGVGEDDLPFFTAPPETSSAVLLVHGFSATPWEMKPLAEDLTERNLACLGVRLPGHGTSPEDLAVRRWEEWLEAVEYGFDLLSANFSRVYAAGLSTGALLVLALARRRQPLGLVLLSPYLRLRHRLAPFAGWLRFLKPYEFRSIDGEESRHYYARRPLAGVHQLKHLIRYLTPQLEEITVPTLAIHGEGDRTIDIDSGRRLVDRLGSTIKVYERLGPEVPHVLTGLENPYRQAVFDLIGKFLGELEAQRCPPESRKS